jgi:HB1, ASXL, restriction endonuclease HTH domain
MKKDHVLIGNLYSAKVSGGVVPVRITEEVWLGEQHAGWKAVNTETGRAVRVKSAQRLRAQLGPSAAKAAKLAPVAGDVGPGGDGAADGEPGRKAASPRPPKATSGGTAKKAKRSQVRPTKGTKKGARRPNPNRPMSGLDAAAKVLADAGEPMRVKDIVEAAAKKGLWKSANGKTPEATVYAAIIREIRDKGVDSRFKKTARGTFEATAEAKK